MKEKTIKTIDKIMNFLDKIGIALAIVLVIILLFTAFLYLLRPLLVSAEEVIPELAVSPGGKINFTAGRPQDWIGQYVKRWFNYIVGGLGIVSVFKVMWGGLKWTTAGGNASQVEAAKTTIKNAVMGIVLLLLSFTIFQTINPALLHLSLPPISKISGEMVCCKNKTTNEKIQRTEKCGDGEEDLGNTSLCSSISKICDKNTTVCGTPDQVNNCMGIKPKDQGICVIIKNGEIIETGFSLKMNQKVKVSEKNNNLGIARKKPCGDIADDSIGYVGSDCKKNTGTNCWAILEKESNYEGIYTISVPSCK